MLEIKDDAVFKLHDDYSIMSMESNGSKYWLFELKQGNIYRLNDVSFSILSLLDGQTCFARVIESVESNYEQVNKVEIYIDAQEFLSLCLNKGIIYQLEDGENEKI